MTGILSLAAPALPPGGPGDAMGGPHLKLPLPLSFAPGHDIAQLYCVEDFETRQCD